MTVPALGFIALCLVLSALFSGLEIAYVSANPLKVEILRRKGGISGFILGYFRDRQARFIGTMVVGNNIVLVLYGILFTEALRPALERLIYGTFGGGESGLISILQTLISSFIILVLAEFLPKALFSNHADSLMKILAGPAFVLYVVLYPVASVLIMISEAALRLAGKPKENQRTFSLKDLSYLVEQSEQSAQSGVDEEARQEMRIFRKALAFRNAKARDCMVPRNDVVAVDVETPMSEVVALFARTGFSKLPVFKGTIDHIIGYVHSYSMFSHPEKLSQCLKPVLIVPESRPIRTILSDLLARHISLAVVVDEFGGTSGILTTEDLIEEIFGEIDDEHDHEKLTESILPDGGFLLSGRLEIDYLNDKYKFQIPESEEYTTLAGFILMLAGTIPSEGEAYTWQQLLFKVRKVHNGRIEEVEVRNTE